LCPLGLYYTPYFIQFAKTINYYVETLEDVEEKKRETIVKDVTILTKMSHTAPICVITSCLFTLILEKLFKEPSLLDNKSGREIFMQYVVETAFWLENRFLCEEDLSKWEKKAIEPISPRLKEIWDKLDTLTNADLIEISNEGTSYCVDSLIMVIGILASTEPSFNSILLASTLGGDTASIASMIGGIIGGMKGSSIFPKPYIEQLYRHQFIIQTAQSFGHILGGL